MNRPVSTVATRYGYNPTIEDDEDVDEDEVACVITGDDL